MKKPYYEKIMDKEPLEIPEQTYNDLILDFECLVKAYFNHLDKPLWQELIEKKFGLKDGKSHTLADIGREFNFTRERARQIQFSILHDLKKLMDGRGLRKPRIICDPSKYPYKAFEDSLRERHLITLPQVEKLIRGYSKATLPYFKNYVDFLMTIYGYDATTHDGIEFYFREFYYVHVTTMVAKLKHFLRHQPLYTSSQKIRKALGLSQDDLESCLCFIKNVESKTVGVTTSYRIALKDLIDSELVIYRILYEQGSPMHIRDIRNKAIKSGWPVVMSHMSSLINRSKIIQTIGRSGVWVLKEWNIDISPIKDILIKVFMEVGKPLKDFEILEKVNLSRSIDLVSLRSFLHLYKKIFVTYVDGTFGLKEWKLKTPIKVGRRYRRKGPFLRDKALKDAIVILTEHKGRMILKDLVNLLTQKGYEIPLIYGALNRRKDLFVKGPIGGRYGRTITFYKS